MDQVVVAIGLFLMAVFVGPWILVWRGYRRRKRENEEHREVWRELTRRVYDLEQTIQRIAPVSTESQAPTQSAPIPSPIVTRASESPTEVAPVTSFTAPAPQQPLKAEQTVPPAAATMPQWTPPVTVDGVERGTLFDRFKLLLNLEETLGRDWLNKVGIALVVLGIAFLLSYEVQTLGPAGKILVGFAVSAALLFVGIWFERNQTYRILARAGIGGGWALLFFTTYAMYHVPAARVLSSQAVDLALMLLVAAVMVWHTLRYNSQVVTGLAFLLGFLTVTISHDTVYSLVAGIVLAAGLATICCRMQWFELEVVGILASYLNHYLWLRPIIEPMSGHRHPFPQFAASAGILTGYWLIFRVSYIVRGVKDSTQERVSTIAALLNTVLLLLLFKYQSAHPEWAFWALLAIGSVEIALSQLPLTKRRRRAVIVLSTVGVVLLIAAFPFRFSGTRLAVLWLLEAEALLLIGVWTREIIFRRLGMAAALVTAAEMICFDAARIAGARFDGADTRADYRVALVFAVASAVFYFTSYWVARRWNKLFDSRFDSSLLSRFSYVGALTSALATWIAFPQSWTVVAWCILVFGLNWFAKRSHRPELRYQAHFLVAISLLRIASVNLGDTSLVGHFSSRAWTMTLAALLLYATRVWPASSHDLQYRPDWDTISSHGYTWSASLVVFLLAWYELRPVSVAVAWAVLGVVLFEVGLARNSISVRLQGYIALLASFCRIFVVNLGAQGNPGELSPRIYTVVPIMLTFFYVYERLRSVPEELGAIDRRWKAADLCAYLGTISVAALMRFEVPTDWVVAAWAALATVLTMVAWRTRQNIFLHQSLLVTFAVLFRTILHNFYQRTYFPAPVWDSRALCVGTTVALLVVALPFTFRLRGVEQSEGRSAPAKLLQALIRRPEQVFFFVAVSLLTVLLALDMRHGMVTVSWGMEGLAVFLLALKLRERSFRLTGLGLLLLCVGKIVVVDAWRLTLRDRYLTLIILGGVLLLVSFLYTRHREAVRQYL